MNAIKKLSKRIPLAVLSIVLSLSLLSAGGIRNKGKLLNPNGSTITTRTISNGVGATGGTIQNGGTITLSPGANFFNFDSAGTGGGTGPGTFWNMLSNGGNHFGTLTTNDLTNSGGSAVGTFHNDTAAVGGGTLNIAGALTNSTASNVITALGTVSYNGAGLQTVSDKVSGNTYGALQTAGSGVKQIPSAVSLAANALSVGTGTGLDENGGTLTLNGTVSLAGTGYLLAKGVGSKTIYASSSAQSVIGTQYYDLHIQGGSTKTALAADTVSNTLTLAASGDVFDMSTFNLHVTAVSTAAISNAGIIQTAGSVAFTGTYNIGGQFAYQATSGTQTVGTATYNTLTLQSGAAANGLKQFPAGTVTVLGTYAASGANRDYALGTFAYGATAGSQNVVGGASDAYNNLTITGSATDTSVYKNVTLGSLKVTNNLLVAANNSLNMNGFDFASAPAGGSSNSGKILYKGGNTVVIAGPGTTEFYASGAIFASATSYGNVEVTNGSAMTISGGTVTSTGGSGTAGFFVYGSTSSLTVNSGATLAVTGQDLYNEGTLTNNGTITVN